MKFHLPIALAVVSPLATVAVMLLLASSRTANAQGPITGGATLSARGVKAFRTLEKVPYFAVGGVGFAGTTSEGEVALRILLKERNRLVVLHSLFKIAKPAGKLYALLGLKQTGTPREVAQIVDSLRPYKGRVATRHGCLMDGEPLGELATKIEKGRIVLPTKRVKPPVK